MMTNKINKNKIYLLYQNFHGKVHTLKIIKIKKLLKRKALLQRKAH